MRQAGSTGYGASWLVRFTVAAVRLACIGGLLLASLTALPARAVAPAAPFTPGATDDTHAGIAARYGALPLAFETNAGQADMAARFVAHGGGFALALAPDAFTLAVNGPRAAGDNGNAPGAAAAVRFAFAGANPAPTLAAEQPLPGVANYLIGNDPSQWHTNVPTSARVRYTSLYPGIDLTVYGTEGGIWEYDALVAPGADPAAFALAISGVDAVTVDAVTGDLVLATAAGEVRQHAPVAYQEINGQRQAVAARYDVRADGNVGFVVGTYNAALPLVIDPTVALAYSTYLGGTGDDIGYGIAVDSSGNAYVTGRTTSTNFPVTPGAFQPANGGSNDAFVTKLNATGTALIYSTYLGGTGDDNASGIAVDSSGNAYVTGFTLSTNFPVTPGAFQITSGGGSFDAFVTKLNATGTALIYSTYLGGTGYDSASGIAVDSSGNAYVTGFTLSTNFPVTPGAFQSAKGGNDDVFVTKLNATGTALIYSTYLGGTGYDEGYGIAVDSSGNAYVTGYTGSTNFPVTPGAFQITSGGGSDAFVTKVNATGTALIYSTYLGGTGSDYGLGIAVDSSGNAYVTGTTTSTNFPVTPGAFQPANGGSNDAFVTKLNATGTALIYSTYLGGTSYAAGSGIAVDSSGNAYVTGNTTSTNFPVTPGAFQITSGGGSDAFVTKVNATGTALIYSTYLGGTSGEFGGDIAVDSSGNAYVTGTTTSTNFPVTPGAFQTTSGGGTNGDAFVTKLGSSTPLPAVAFTVTGFPSPVTAGTSGSVTVTARDANNNVVTGYTGTVAITSSDPNAILPPNATLTNGVGTFTVTLNTLGTQSITATDAPTGTLTGTQAGITVTGVAPTAVADTASVSSGQSVRIAVLANDTLGTPAATITAVSTPGHGMATISGTSISYTPTAGYVGSDSFTYTIGNSAGSSTATVSITVTASATLTGLSVTPTAPTLRPGETLTLTTVGIYSNGISGAVSPLTYGSSNPAVASVDPMTGRVTANTAGQVTITVMGPNNTSTTITVTVMPAPGSGLMPPAPAPMTHASAPVAGATPAPQPATHPAGNGSGGGVAPQAAGQPTATPNAQPARH